MNSSDFVAKLKELGLPVFTIGAASSIIQKSAAYTRVYISRLLKSGAVNMIERGKYCLPGTDEYTVASRIVPHSYITGYAALEHYKLTTQITTKLQVVAPRYHRPLKLANYVVKFSKVKNGFIYGYTTLESGPVFADPEKVFIDDVYLHRRQHYSEEFDYAIDAGRLSMEKLEKYAAMSNNGYVQRFITDILESPGASHTRARKRMQV